MNPASNERRNVIIPSDWWEAFRQAAAKAGKPISVWLREAAAEKLPRKIRESLSEAKGVGRPRNPEESDE